MTLRIRAQILLAGLCLIGCGSNSEGPHDVGGEDSVVEAEVKPGPEEWAQANEGWFGGECGEASNCNYAGGACFFPADMNPDDPVGLCSQLCEQDCPAPTGGPMQYETFCAELVEGKGYCVPKCSPTVPCPLNFECWLTPRFDDPQTEVYACMPPAGNE